MQTWRFLDWRPPHSEFKGTKPSKGTCINQNTTFESLSVQFGPKLRPVSWPRKQKKKIGEIRKSQIRYISPPCGGAISQPICTKFDEFVDLADVITPAKFGSKIFIDFSRIGGKKHFPVRNETAHLSVARATAHDDCRDVFYLPWTARHKLGLVSVLQLIHDRSLHDGVWLLRSATLQEMCMLILHLYYRSELENSV